MRKLREVLRLRFELKLGYQQIGRSCSIAVSTVHKYLKRAEAAGVTWPLPEDWDEARRRSGAVPAPGASGGRGAIRAHSARLRHHPRAAAKEQARDLAVAVGGVPAGESRRLSLLADSATCISDGARSWTWCCGRSTKRARRCSSIGPVRRFRSMTGTPARHGKRLCSWPHWAPVSYTWAEATRDQQMEAWLRGARACLRAFSRHSRTGRAR